MHWLLHFSVPALVALLEVAVTASAPGRAEGVAAALSRFGESYLLFSTPYWLWSVAAAYFGASRRVFVGGCSGAHALLVAVTLLVFRATAPEAANGWLLYFIGSPVAIGFGAFVGGRR